MPKYIVPATFFYKAHFLVEAESMEDAIGKFASLLTTSAMPSVKAGRELRSRDDGAFAERSWDSMKISEFQLVEEGK